MTPNPNQDIEHLLQQYADDRRAQQATADKLRAMERHQRHTRRAVVAALLLLLTGGAVPLLLKPLTLPTSPANTRGNVAICEQDYAPIAHAPTPDQTTPPQINPSHRQKSTPKQAEKPTAGIASAITADQLPPLHTGTPSYMDNTGNLRETQIMNPKMPEGITAALADRPLNNPHTNTSKRHTLVATIGAIAPFSTHGDAAPLLTASVGLNVALASSSNYEVNIGVGVDGYINVPLPQSKSSDNTHFNSIDGTENFHGQGSYQSDQELLETFGWYYPTLGLYVTLPLTFDLYPRGRDKTGMQLTLTPGHTLTPVTTHRGTATLHGLNPWKFTAGLGLTLPKGALNSISFTADLLPSYLRGPLEGIHQIGVIFAF
ncbi:MAG: hypothetical protein IJ785_08640 [Bacteroidales bacterium]|nr:hypothetical protein [Bacteroidales bacterium]